MRRAAAARAAASLGPRCAALAAVAFLTACGGGGDDEGPAVAWEGRPQVARHPEIPGDVLVTARVRNESDSELRLDAADVRVVSSDGRPIRAAATFAAGYSHSLYPPRDAPREAPRAEAERLGHAATIEPGDAAPLTIAWHRPRSGRAVRIELGGEQLPLP